MSAQTRGWTRYLRVAIAIAVASCVAAVPTKAQQTSDAADVADLSLEQLLDVEVQSVFGASRFLQKVNEAPASVTIITSDDIRRYGYRNLADLLGRARGVFTTYDRSYAYAGIRGFQRLGDYNTRMLLLIDGIRANDNVYEQAYIGDEFLVDLELVDRVEIIRGPSSSVYGTNAFFGVVNVITRRAAQLPGVRVGSIASSFGGRAAQVSVGHVFGNGTDVVLSASATDIDGQRTLYFPELDAVETNGGIAERLDWMRRRNVFGKVVLGNLEAQGAFTDRRKGVPTAAFGSVFNDTDARIEDQLGLVRAAYSRHLGPLSVRSQASWGHVRYLADMAFTGLDAPTPIRNDDIGIGRWWTADTSLSTTWRSTHRLTAGVEVRHNVDQDQWNYDQAPYESYLDDRRGSVNGAWYAQDEWRLGSRHLLNVGVRHDYHTHFTAPLMPRLAWVIMPAASSTVKLLYGGAFRAPSAYETWYAHGPYKGNLALTPERIRTAEAVVEQHLGRRYRASANVFKYWVEDLITQVVDPADGQFVFENDGDARTTGVELEVEGRWPRGVSGRVSYARQRAVDVGSGLRLDGAPGQVAQVAFTFPLLSDDVQAAVDVQAVGERRAKTGDRLAGYAVPNLTIAAPALWHHLDVSFSIYNVLNRRYIHPVSDDVPVTSIAQDGRTVRLRAVWRF